MQISVDDVSSLTKKMTIVVPRETVSKRMEEAYRNLASEVSIKGFRKGKVPRKVLEKNYAEKVQHDLADKMIQETYFDAVEEVNLDVVAHPDVKSFDFVDDGTFSYVAEVDVRPIFDLVDYKGVEVEQEEVVIADADVDAEIEALRRQKAPLRNVEDRGIQNGDLAVIDFQGFHDGAPMKQVKGENYSVDVGSGQNGKEFEENFIGLKKGEKTTRTMDFPADFANPVLAGKQVEFQIEVKDVKERVLADIDDEFAKDVDEKFTTLADLKDHLREAMRQQKEDSMQGDLTDKLMMKILEANDFEVPNRLVAYEVNELINEAENNLKRQNPNMTLESAGIKREDLIERYKESATRRVKGDFIIKKIAEIEGIKVEEADISQGFQRIAEQYGMPVDEVKKYFQNRNDLLPFMNELLNEKVVGFLRDNAVIKKVAPGQQAAEANDSAGESK